MFDNTILMRYAPTLGRPNNRDVHFTFPIVTDSAETRRTKSVYYGYGSRWAGVCVCVYANCVTSSGDPFVRKTDANICVPTLAG